MTAIVSMPPSLVSDAGAPVADAATIDLQDAKTGRSRPAVDRVVSDSASSDILPPLEHTLYDSADEAPERLDEAVPVGQAFDDGLASLTDGETGHGADEGGMPSGGGGAYNGSRGALDGPPPDVASFDTGPRPTADPSSRTSAGLPARRRSNGASTAPEPLPGAPVAHGAGANDHVAAPEPARLFGPPAGERVNGSTASTTMRGPDSGMPDDMADGQVDAPEAAVAEPSAPPEVTASGLVKRVPRGAGAARAVPGSGGEARGVGANRRSPEEVRNLLSRYREGQERGRIEEPAGAGPNDERDAHE